MKKPNKEKSDGENGMKNSKRTKLVLIALFIILIAVPLSGTCNTFRQFLSKIIPSVDFWYSYMGYVGMVTVAFVAIWQTNRANEQAAEAHAATMKVLSIEEHSKIPYLSVLRDSCDIKLITENRIRIKIHTRNMSIFPVHNIMLALGVLSDEQISLLYTPDNFNSWMSNLAKLSNTDITTSSDDIIFVASLSESVVRKRVSYKNGQLNENIYDEYTDAQSFYLNYDFSEEVDNEIPLTFIMENINGVRYRQTTKLYILKIPDGYYMFNHSTKVEPMEE